MTPWRLAVKQIRHNPLRCGLILASVSLAAMTLCGVIVLIAGADESIRRTVGQMGADLMVVPRGEDTARQFNELMISGKPASFYLPADSLRQIVETPGVAGASPQTFVETLSNASCCAGKFFLVGFDPNTDVTIQPWLKAPLPAGERLRGNWIVVGDRILLKPGDSVMFYGTEFTVAGVLEPTGMGMDWTVFLPDAAMRRMVADSGIKGERALPIRDRQVSAVFVKVRPDTDPIDLAERIEQDQPNLQAILSSTVVSEARRHLGGMRYILWALTGVVCTTAMLLCGILFAQSVRQRQAELGLLTAKGARRGFLFRLLLAESLTISLAGAAIGAILAVGVLAALRESLASMLGVLDILPPVSVAMLYAAGLGAAVALAATVATLAPARSVLRMEPYQAIRAGQVT